MDRARLSVLLVEDDAKLARLTRDYLEQHDVGVIWVSDGDSAVREALRPAIDAVILDLMLPGRDGFEVCREIRAHSHVPIIAVTARVEVADRVLGLELGADDYVTKPFSARELLARVRAVVRRAEGRSGPTARELTAGSLVLDLARLSATLDGRPLALTSYEFSLLRALVENAGRVLSRERLLELAKGNADEAFDRSIDVRISRLRQKLGDDSKHPVLLKTVRGSGYVLTAPEPK
ncbi:MAG TPA: response regulator transcription factor [Polyangiaceae bacterium]|nr:response regulator transcription factor [Polyangiaceae bacterium]